MLLLLGTLDTRYLLGTEYPEREWLTSGPVKFFRGQDGSVLGGDESSLCWSGGRRAGRM